MPQGPTQSPRAFTVAELIVVTAVVLIMLTLGVAGWRAVIGDSSIEAATNQVSAFVGRAREEARALRVPRGVMFYRDPEGRAVMGLVVHDDPHGRPAQVELVAGSEVQPLRAGVGTAFATPVGATGSRYVEHGLILFDGDGQLFIRDYSVRMDGDLGRRMGLHRDQFALASIGVTLYIRSVGDTQLADKRDAWLDSKGRPLFVSRYSGTLVEGTR
jgi:hypothetical protein